MNASPRGLTRGRCCEEDPRITIRHDGLQARKQACRVASENGVTFHIIQRRALQHVFGSCGKVPALVGKVCSVQNLIDARDVTQHTGVIDE